MNNFKLYPTMKFQTVGEIFKIQFYHIEKKKWVNLQTDLFIYIANKQWKILKITMGQHK